MRAGRRLSAEDLKRLFPSRPNTPEDLERLFTSGVERDLDDLSAPERSTLAAAFSDRLFGTKLDDDHDHIEETLSRLPVTTLRLLASRIYICRDCRLTVGVMIKRGEMLFFAARRRNGKFRLERTWRKDRGSSGGYFAPLICSCRVRDHSLTVSDALAPGADRVEVNHDTQPQGSVI